MNVPIKSQVTTMTLKDASMSSTALTPAEDNPFSAYADAALVNNIAGTLLLFSKGDWLAGQDKRPIAPGTKLIAHMGSFSVGWVRWSNGKPADSRMGRVVDRFKPAWRNDLGDNDADLWERDDRGDPKDPWQFTNNLELADPATGEVFTFSTASKGGRRCLDMLCRQYGRELGRHPDDWPMVELGVDSYLHPKREYGRIKDPTLLPIVGWAAKDEGCSSAVAPAVFPKVGNPLGEPPPDEDGYPGFSGDDFPQF